MATIKSFTDIEQKAKAYDEALERAKIWQNHLNESGDKDYADELEYIFPELAESEDERIRKCVKYAIDKLFLKEKIVCDVHKDDVIAWLEKQGETYTKKDVDDAYLKGVCDAKQELEKYAPIDIDKMVDDYANNEEFGKPLNSMIRAYRQGLKDAIGKVVSESAWTEEDEEMLDGIILRCEKYGHQEQINWLKSLKDRYTWKPTEEQMDALLVKIPIENSCNKVDNILKSLYSDLKRLK